MTAYGSGNRISGTAHDYRPTSAGGDEPEQDLVSPAPVVRRSYERELFVYHQQDLARRALHLGSPGAARAALRALYGADFADARCAMKHLSTLRDPTATPDEVTHALRALVQLEPVGDGPRRGTSEIAFLRRDTPRDED
jgi:hypothetical protein